MGHEVMIDGQQLAVFGHFEKASAVIAGTVKVVNAFDALSYFVARVESRPESDVSAL